MFPILIYCSLYGTGKQHQYFCLHWREDTSDLGFLYFLFIKSWGKNHNPESPKLSRESNAPSMVSTVSPLLLDIYKN